MAQPQLVCHSPCHPCMVCDARFSPGQGGEEIAPRSLNRQNARLRQGRARPCHICTGTGLTPAHGLCCCRSTAAPQPRMSVLPTPVDWHRPRAPSRATAAAESLRAAVPCNNVSCGCADVRSSRGHCRACGAATSARPGLCCDAGFPLTVAPARRVFADTRKAATPSRTRPGRSGRLGPSGSLAGRRRGAGVRVTE